jgi:Ni/Fe-hydrogenase 1 B-type cytochrome subunit
MFHHLFAWGFVFFVILHVYIVSLDDALYRNGLVSSMFSGNKMRRVRARPIERQRLRGEDGGGG